jgi:hypothetical protein
MFTLQIIETLGVPYRIRTGVAAVREAKICLSVSNGICGNALRFLNCVRFRVLLSNVAYPRILDTYWIRRCEAARRLHGSRRDGTSGSGCEAGYADGSREA